MELTDTLRVKIVNHWDKPDDSVVCAEKENKSGQELVRMNNAYMQAPLKKKKKIGMLLFCKFLEFKGLFQKVCLFHFGIGLAQNKCWNKHGTIK